MISANSVQLLKRAIGGKQPQQGAGETDQNQTPVLMGWGDQEQSQEVAWEVACEVPQQDQQRCGGGHLSLGRLVTLAR